MRYYDVETLISLSRGSSIFTYSSELPLAKGSIVLAPFGRSKILGFVLNEVKKPDFNIKPIQKCVLQAVVPNNYISYSQWFQSFYASKKDEISAIFLPSFLKDIPAKPKIHSRQPSGNYQHQTLTGDQKNAVMQIEESLQPVILHGIVGSGKTRIYFELANKNLSRGKSSLILSPEIPLSSQLAKRAREFFGTERVILYHSALTASEKRALWLELLLSEEPKVVIGPRSSLFLPYKELGLVCIDEFHEASYKQQDKIRYHASDAAAALAKINKAQLVLGSATPALREYEIANQKKYPIIRLDALAMQENESERKYKIVDQRDRSKFTKDPYLSNELIRAIGEALSNEQQTLLLHNRRGTARTILCENCGWTMDCPRCDGHLVYHQDLNSCVCHICGYKSGLPVVCPDCGKTELLLRSIGTKALVTSLQKLFPKANIARFDSDNLKAESLGSRLEEVESGNVDILVGTQLLAKGLDLKRLSLVGVTSADSSLNLPDFSSAERLYQLIVQVAGRVGRGHGNGTCIVQTYQPNHPLFEAIVSEDWKTFYETEISERRQHAYPPFCFVAKLECTRKTIAGAEKASNALAKELASKYRGVKILGPTSAFREKKRGSYTQILILKSASRKKLLEIAKSLPSGWTADLDPISLI